MTAVTHFKDKEVRLKESNEAMKISAGYTLNRPEKPAPSSNSLQGLDVSRNVSFITSISGIWGGVTCHCFWLCRLKTRGESYAQLVGKASKNLGTMRILRVKLLINVGWLTSRGTCCQSWPQRSGLKATLYSPCTWTHLQTVILNILSSTPPTSVLPGIYQALQDLCNLSKRKKKVFYEV